MEHKFEIAAGTLCLRVSLTNSRECEGTLGASLLNLEGDCRVHSATMPSFNALSRRSTPEIVLMQISKFFKQGGKLDYWASEASPTLGCSIEISVCRYVCLSCPKMRRRNYVAQTRAYSNEISVCRYVCLSCPKMRRRNYVAQTRAYSKSVLADP